MLSVVSRPARFPKKKLAVDCGLQVGKLRSRENIVKALAEMDTFVSAEEDGEEPPIMEAEAPVR